MGCSASRSHTLITDYAVEERFSNLSSSHNPNSTPLSRALSLPTPLVHHPPLCKGDTNHLVSLTSTTYGSLILIDPMPNPNPNLNGQDFSKTQSTTDLKEPSLSPDTVINTWELMEGLEDDEFEFDFVQKPNSSAYNFPIESPQTPNTNNYFDSDGSLEKSFEMVEKPKPENPESKPLWKHLSEEKLLAKMDPNVGFSYRKALSTKQLGNRNTEQRTVQPLSSGTKSNLSSCNELMLPGTEDRIVLYYTSLRGIRRTYEDCCAVRMIFRGFRVYVDERDISMDSEYRKELQSVLKGKAMSLPQVFIRGKHIGGADEIKQLHECGTLSQLLEGFAIKDLGYVCESCGDARFLPCPNCNGSRKVFEEDEDTLRRCPDCNENGLIRCPNCCS